MSKGYEWKSRQERKRKEKKKKSGRPPFIKIFFVRTWLVGTEIAVSERAEFQYYQEGSPPYRTFGGVKINESDGCVVQKICGLVSM
jgi:hypothetical protein